MNENIEHLKIKLEMAYEQKLNLRLNPIQCKELLEDIIKLEEKLKKPKAKKESKKIYGEYKHVRLTEKEFDSLLECYGEELTKRSITYLDEYIEMKGYKAKSHYLCIKKWVVEAVNNQNKNYKYNNPSAKVEQVPEWFKKEIKAEKPTDEEVAELREMLKEYE